LYEKATMTTKATTSTYVHALGHLRHAEDSLLVARSSMQLAAANLDAARKARAAEVAETLGQALYEAHRIFTVTEGDLRASLCEQQRIAEAE
jgi:hypothetical protein